MSRTPRTRRTTGALAAGAVIVALTLTAGSVAAPAAPPPGPAQAQTPAQAKAKPSDSPETAPLTTADRAETRPQTSDGEPPGIARKIQPGDTSRRQVAQATTPLARGVTYEYLLITGARGPQIVHLLRVDPGVKGTRLDYLGTRKVRSRQTVPELAGRDGGAAAVNGDFFDITDTFAPLGNGQDRQRGLLHGRRADWTNSFWIDADGRPRVGQLAVGARVVPARGSALQVWHVNSPTVWPDRIGLYTPKWGKLAGTRVTDGQTRRVREVHIRNGRVAANRTRLTRNQPIEGVVLVGRGRGARQLSRLKVGRKVTVERAFPDAPAVAISGSEVLLRKGQVLSTDDTALHPRTAVGVDRDTGELLLVVVDGRSTTSRGATLVELADLMAMFGAEAALNLDGGGSSTMVGADPAARNGALRVLNTPSDGQPRMVPNGLVVFARPLPDQR